jgi:PAS domain S-box-containing protein
MPRIRVAQASFNRRLLRAIALPLLLMVILAGVLLWQTQNLLRVVQWIDHTDQVIAQANYAEKLLIDMETGLRGYLLTGNPIFLEPYRKASPSMELTFNKLSGLIEDNPDQQQHIRQLRSLYQQWYRYSQQMIALRQQGREVQAEGINLEGKQRMDTMRYEIISFLQVEEQLRQTRTQAAQETAGLVISNLIGLTIGVGSLLAAFSKRQLVGVSNSYRQALESYQAQTEALTESEEQFRATFEQAAVGIAHVGIDGRWLKVNQKLCDLVGYTREEMLARTFQDITYPDDLDTDLNYVRQMLAGEIDTYSIEKRYRCKQGALIWIQLTVALVREATGQPKYFISVIADISDRKQAQITLYRSNQRLEALQAIDRAILKAHSLEELVHSALSRMEELVFCDQSLVVLFNFEQHQAQVIVHKLTGDWTFLKTSQMPLEEFVPSEVWHPESSGIPFTFFLDYPPILKRQNVKEMGSYLTVPLVANEEIIGQIILATLERGTFNIQALEIINEVTNQIAIAIHQAQLREQLQQKADELEQRVVERTLELQAANAELEAFAYSVSHDLRAPLRAMQGFSQALLEDYGEHLDILGQQYANRISDSAQRMEGLIQDLLTYSRLSRSEIQLQPLNLKAVVMNVIAQLEPEFQERQAQVTVEPSFPSVKVMGQRVTLDQVIINLLMNAIKFVAVGVQPQIHIWAEEWNISELGASHQWVRLWIADNGIGIAPEHQDRIFRVFERLHGIETYPGTGIGLAIVRKGMERMGGLAGVESDVGRGSQFWIALAPVERPA